MGNKCRRLTWVPIISGSHLRRIPTDTFAGEDLERGAGSLKQIIQQCSSFPRQLCRWPCHILTHSLDCWIGCILVDILILQPWDGSVLGGLQFPKLSWIVSFRCKFDGSCQKPSPSVFSEPTKIWPQNLTKTVFITRHFIRYTTQETCAEQKLTHLRNSFNTKSSLRNFWQKCADRNENEINTNLMRPEDDHGDNGPFWQQPAQWPAFGASEPSSRSDLRKVETVAILTLFAHWHWGGASGDFDHLCSFLTNLANAAQCIYMVEMMTRGIQENVGGVEGKSRITFSVEQKQDGKSILPLCHWERTRQTSHCPP